MKKIPMIIQHTGLADTELKKLEVLFDNGNRKLYDIFVQKFGKAAADAFTIYIDNTDPIPTKLQEKTVRATNASQNVTPDTGYDGLSKVVIPAGIVLSSVAKTAGPTKTEYTAGETFDKTGLTATATYSNNATLALTATDLVAPTTALTVEDTSVTITYTEAGVSKTFDVTITVTA